VCLASIHISCGDVSDTCITGDRFDVCYYKNELTESDASRVLKAMQGFAETFSSKLKVNKDSDGQISAFIEINTNTSEEKQKAFLI
jgi:hypothetical protein